MKIKYYSKQTYGRTFRYFADATIEEAVNGLTGKKTKFKTTITPRIENLLTKLECTLEEVEAPV